MEIRECRHSELDALARIFRETIMDSCAGNYTQAQLRAWAAAADDASAWEQSFEGRVCLVAIEDARPVGFVDLAPGSPDTEGAYLDRLYVSKGWQGRGMATLLCGAVERLCSRTVTTHASLTAQPFFERRGYTVLRAQHVDRHGQTLRNFVMRKTLPSRTILRRFEAGDLEALHGLLSDPLVMCHLEPPFSREQTARFLAEEDLCEQPRIFAVEQAGTFVGYVIYHDYDENSVELGWVLSPHVWRHGLAQELTCRLVACAHAAGKGAVLECVPEQAVTRHIAQKLGFSRRPALLAAARPSRPGACWGFRTFQPSSSSEYASNRRDHGACWQIRTKHGPRPSEDASKRLPHALANPPQQLGIIPAQTSCRSFWAVRRRQLRGVRQTCTNIGNLGKGPKQERGTNMKATVNEDCIGCGLCEGTCPEVFSLTDDGVATAIEEDVPEDAEETAQEAADNCPVSAIEVE